MDSSSIATQQRTGKLVKAVKEEDLYAVLGYIHELALEDQASSLDEALVAAVAQFTSLSLLTVAVLLQKGASRDRGRPSAIERARGVGNREALVVLEGRGDTSLEVATAELLLRLALADARDWIERHLPVPSPSSSMSRKSSPPTAAAEMPASPSAASFGTVSRPSYSPSFWSLPPGEPATSNTIIIRRIPHSVSQYALSALMSTALNAPATSPVKIKYSAETPFSFVVLARAKDVPRAVTSLHGYRFDSTSLPLVVEPAQLDRHHPNRLCMRDLSPEICSAGQLEALVRATGATGASGVTVHQDLETSRGKYGYANFAWYGQMALAREALRGRGVDAYRVTHSGFRGRGMGLEAAFAGSRAAEGGALGTKRKHNDTEPHSPPPKRGRSTSDSSPAQFPSAEVAVGSQGSSEGTSSGCQRARARFWWEI